MAFPILHIPRPARIVRQAGHFLRQAAHTFPGKTLTGRSLDIVPSDNIEMLRDNFNDELFIKETRTDAIYGLVALMEQG
jgi:hypothetical protein